MTRSATLHLRFALGANGKTALYAEEQQPPWRVMRGFPNAAGETLAHMNNVSGGILDSDRLRWRIEVGPNALAQVTSIGATRVYRSRSGDQTATQHGHISVDEGGFLEYLPDPLIPFAGSRFEQTIRAELAPKASLICWEAIAPGREASGEVFEYAALSSSFELIADGSPVAVERWRLDPREQKLGSAARLGQFRHFASCYFCRTGESPAYWRTLESALQPEAEQLSNPDVLWGITSLRAHGLAIRGVAVNARAMVAGLHQLWRIAKPKFCGRAATLPRKIY